MGVRARDLPQHPILLCAIICVKVPRSCGLSKTSPVVYLAAAMAAYAALWLLIPRATFLPVIVQLVEAAMPFATGHSAFYLSFVGAVVVLAPTLGFMCSQVAIVYFFTKIRLSLWQCLLALVVCLIVAEGLLSLVIWQSRIPAQLGRYPGFREQLLIMGIYYGPLKIPLTLALIVASASVGYLVSLRIKDKNIILPVVMLAAYIDFWTVTRGPVSVVLEHAPEVVEAVSAPIPQVGTGVFMPATMIGPGDFLFMGLIFAAIHKLGMNGVRNFWFIYAATALGMMAVMLGLIPWLPALVVLAVAVVAANWREFKLSRQEKISVAVVAAILLISVPIVWSVFRPHVEKALKQTPKTPITAPEHKPR